MALFLNQPHLKLGLALVPTPFLQFFVNRGFRLNRGQTHDLSSLLATGYNCLSISYFGNGFTNLQTISQNVACALIISGGYQFCARAGLVTSCLSRDHFDVNAESFHNQCGFMNFFSPLRISLLENLFAARKTVRSLLYVFSTFR